MKDNPWPPPAPDMSGSFKKARDFKQTPPAGPIVTKKQVQELESQRKRPVGQLNLTPPGVRPSTAADRDRAARIERMKKKLQEKQGKARDDFNRSM